MRKMITLFALALLAGCSNDEVNYTAQFAAASPCSNTPLGITEAARRPWPDEGAVNPSENIWRWCKRNDTLYVFMSQVGIDSRIIQEYVFLARPGKCIQPIDSGFRDTYGETDWETGATNPPIIYRFPITETVQYYVENLFLVGRFTEKISETAERNTDVWVNFSADTEKPDYRIQTETL